MSRVQNSGESIAEYVHALKQLARDCEFQQVSADRYRDELTRDSFINEISSSAIRQRLLQEDQLTLQTAVNKAEMLDRAQKQSSFYAEKVTMRSVSTSGNTALHKDAGEKCSMRISKRSKAAKMLFLWRKFASRRQKLLPCQRQDLQ